MLPKPQNASITLSNRLYGRCEVLEVFPFDFCCRCQKGYTYINTVTNIFCSFQIKAQWYKPMLSEHLRLMPTRHTFVQLLARGLLHTDQNLSSPCWAVQILIGVCMASFSHLAFRSCLSTPKDETLQRFWTTSFLNIWMKKYRLTFD